MKLFTLIIAIFITGCSSLPEDNSFGETNNSVEKEDEILTQQLTSKKKPGKNNVERKTGSLNDNVIEEDLIISTTSSHNDKTKSKPKKSDIKKMDDLDDAELDDAIDGDALDKDYRKKTPQPPSDNKSNN